MATVRIPAQMRSLVGGAATVAVDGETVAEVLASLKKCHSALAARVFDDQGRVRRFVNIFLEGEDIRFIGGLQAEVGPDQTLSLLPAVAGG